MRAPPATSAPPTPPTLRTPVRLSRPRPSQTCSSRAHDPSHDCRFPLQSARTRSSSPPRCPASDRPYPDETPQAIVQEPMTEFEPTAEVTLHRRTCHSHRIADSL